MTTFTTTYTESFDLNGTPVKITFRRMKRRDVTRVLPLLPQPEGADDDEQRFRFNLKETPELFDLFAELLPAYIVGIETDATVDGEPLNVNHIVEEMFCLPIFYKSCSSMMQRSFANEDQVKKSDGPRSDTPPVTGS